MIKSISLLELSRQLPLIKVKFSLCRGRQFYLSQTSGCSMNQILKTVLHKLSKDQSLSPEGKRVFLDQLKKWSSVQNSISASSCLLRVLIKIKRIFSNIERKKIFKKLDKLLINKPTNPDIVKNISPYQLDYWKITPPSGGPPSYLLGTVHNGVPFRELPSKLLKAFEECKAVATEEGNISKIDFSKVLEPATWQLCQQRTGKTAEELLALDDPRELIQLLTQVELASMDADIAVSAIKKGKLLYALDDNPNERLSEDAQCYKTWVEEAIADPEKSKKEFENINAIFRRSALSFLKGNTPLGDCSNVNDLSKRSAKGRNKQWISKLLPLMNTTSVFIAVGMGHLFAVTPSVQELLIEQGCKLTKISSG